MIDVLIVDDNPIVRAALRGYLSTTEQVRVVGEARDGSDAVVIARRLHPTVTLLDYRMPVADGLSVLDELVQHSIVLVLTSDSDPDLIAKMLRGGARGYLVHGDFDPPELLRAVCAVANNQGWLHPQAASVAAAAMREQVTQERIRVEHQEHQRQARTRLGLTQREEIVIGLLTKGLSNSDIARQLVLSEKTVKNHLNHIFAKLQVNNRTEAAARWSTYR